MDKNTFRIKPGVDIEEVFRIRHLYEKWGDKFLHRVFTDREIEYCMSKAACFSHLTGRFAAKEAVIKALKTTTSPPLKSIEIICEDNGRPRVELHGEAKKTAQQMKISKIEVSISHTRKFGAAFIITY